MRLVLFSDLHLDTQFAWLGGNQQGARRRRQALRETLLRIVQLVADVGAEALLCGGDLYEQDRFSPDTAEFLRAVFARLSPVPVYVAPGNHDWYGPASLYRQIKWSSNVHVFTSDRLEPVTLVDGLTLWGAAHRAPANTRGFLDGFTVDRAGMHLALFHGSERGWLAEQEVGKAPHAPFSAEQIEQAGLHHVFLGHYHRPRDEARYTYPGNPEPLTFGEAGLRGAVVVTVEEDGAIIRDRRRMATTATHDLVADVTGCTSQQEVRERVAGLLARVQGLKAGEVARVTLSGELGAEVDLRPGDLADVAPWLDGLVVQVRYVRVAYALGAIAQESTVRGQFVRDVLAAEGLTEEERRRVLATGLRALDGRDDLEVL